MTTQTLPAKPIAFLGVLTLAVAAGACGHEGGSTSPSMVAGAAGGTAGGTTTGGTSTGGTGTGTTTCSIWSYANDCVRIGSSATASGTQKSGWSQLYYIPDGSNIAFGDRTLTPDTTVVTVGTDTASVTFKEQMILAAHPLGTGVLKRDDSAPTVTGETFYRDSGANNRNEIFLSTVADVTMNGTDLLQDMSYGLVRVAGPNGKDYMIGSFIAGDYTPVANIPKQATYVGQFAGIEAPQGATLADITQIQGKATVVLDVYNKNNKSIIGDITGLTYRATGLPVAYGIHFDGNVPRATGGVIRYNEFAAGAVYTNPNGAAPPLPKNSATTGYFYGPNGAEIGGVIRIEGQAPTDAGGTAFKTVTGAFGAKKQ